MLKTCVVKGKEGKSRESNREEGEKRKGRRKEYEGKRKCVWLQLKLSVSVKGSAMWWQRVLYYR